MTPKEKTDIEAFNTLFARCREPFTQFAFSYVRDYAAAEDVVTEAMMEYWEKRNGLPLGVNAPAYILTSVKNRSLNYLRHLRVEVETQEILLTQGNRELDFRISSLEACDPQELFTTEIQDIIRKALKELPEQTRLIFCKSRFENCSNHEIATHLGISIKTVEYHIHKALCMLRHRLKDYFPLLFFLEQYLQDLI